jgi:hypothetical protein
MEASQKNYEGPALFSDFVMGHKQERIFNEKWLEDEEFNHKYLMNRLESYTSSVANVECKDGTEFEGKSSTIDTRQMITDGVSDDEKKVYLFNKCHNNIMNSRELAKTLEVFDPNLNNIPYITTDSNLDKRFDYDPNAAMKRPIRKKLETDSEFYLHNPVNREPLIKYSPSGPLPRAILNASDDILGRLKEREQYRNSNTMKKEYFWGFNPCAEGKPFFGNRDYIKNLHVEVVKKNLKCLKHRESPVAAVCLYRGCRIGRLCCAICSKDHSSHVENLLVIDNQHSFAPETLATKLGIRDELRKIIRSVELDWNEVSKRAIQDVDTFYRIWCFEKIEQHENTLKTSYNVKIF